MPPTNRNARSRLGDLVENPRETLEVELKNWLDIVGSFHSDAMRVRERFTPTGPDSITYEATIEDRNVYTRPWTIRVRLERIKEEGNGPIELLEHACHEGERDQPLMAPK